MLEAFALPHQRPLQDDAALLVALALLCGEFVHPTKFAVAVLAADITHHVPPRQHDSVLHLAVLQIHNLENTNHTSLSLYRIIAFLIQHDLFQVTGFSKLKNIKVVKLDFYSKANMKERDELKDKVRKLLKNKTMIILS